MVAGFGVAVAFVDDDAEECPVVGSFGLCFAGPGGEAGGGTVFGFDDDAVTLESDAADVAAVFGPGFDSAVDPVVYGGGEVVGYEAFESGAGCFG